MRMGLTSAGREEEAVVRRHVATDLEHDLGGGPEAQGARVAATPDSIDVQRDRAAKRREAAGPECLPPNAEDAAERRAALEVDDAARIERPNAGSATSRDDAAEAKMRVLEPDRCRDDDDSATGEEFKVNARPNVQRRRPTNESRGRRLREWPVTGPCAHRRGYGPQHCCRRRDREGAKVHRHQATRAIVCLLACALAAGLGTSSAKADGDPASDYLVSQPVFLGYDAKVPPAAQRKLLAAVASATRNGYPIKVALIWSSYDLGSVPELFRKPKTYARFLDAEDSKCWWGGSCGSGRFKTTTRLVVVMPNGLGFAQWKHSPASGYRALAGIKVTRTPAGLADAATTAVVKLADAAGVKVSTRGGPTTPTSLGGGGTNRLEIITAVVVALLLGVAARILVRRRAARSALR
jgi:hypothetical protein